MSSNRLVAIALTMTNCQLDDLEPARQVLDIFGDAGCKFILGRSPDPHPERRILHGQIIAPMSFTHPLLKPCLDSRARRLKLGGGRLSYVSAHKKILVFQTTDRPKELDDLILGVLEFAKYFHAHFCPTYAYIDEVGKNATQCGVASSKGVKFLFWANVFGRKIVKQVGEEYLLQCPARVEVLEDGGILLASRDRFTKWLQRPERASIEYLAQKFPRIHRFRSAGVEC